MKLKRIMIAAPKSGSGKTIITCALLQALKDMGQQVVSYKCGPDYIDPLFHERILGVPSKNLDTFFTGEKKTKELFLRDRGEEDFAVMEGVMGIFDGILGIREEGSSYHLARVTRTPIILVVDAKGMGYSIIPLISGFLKYDSEHLIQGVLLNRISRSYYEVIGPLIEKELKICVAGYFPEQKQLCIESRHLGLKLPYEMQNLKKKIQVAAEEMRKGVSLTNILQIAENAENIEIDKEDTSITKKTSNLRQIGEAIYVQSAIGEEKKPIIAVARDEAFCFYYADNLHMLQENGAILSYFSPIHDKRLPENCKGLLFGGGYPELFAKELSENKEMLLTVHHAIEGGMPVIAECGGFMYLHSKLEDSTGEKYSLVGSIPAVCYYTERLVRFGYVEIEERKKDFLPVGKKIRGHEFHYFNSTYNGNDCLAEKPAAGKSYTCIIKGENYWLGFPHLYYPSNPEFARYFVEKTREYKK